MVKARRMKLNEDDEQTLVISWAAFNKTLSDRLMHIANERKCSPAYGQKLKRMGVKKGASDLFLAWPIGKHGGCFIEMKSRDGELKEHQRIFLNNMQDAGYFTDVCRSFEEARNTIEKYLCGDYTRNDRKIDWLTW